jgi:hypothetical protein
MLVITLKMHPEMYAGLYVKHPLFLSVFNLNWNVLTNSSKIPQYKISRKPIQLPSYKWTDQWTDMEEETG